MARFAAALLSLSLFAGTAGAAAPPPASEARTLAEKKAWDDLYLRFSAVAPDGYAAADRESIAAALLKGAHGLEREDAVLATSLAERAVAFHESVDALVYAAQLDAGLHQTGEAVKLLDRALKLDAKSGPAHFTRAAVALDDGEPQLALQHLDAIGPGYEPGKVKALRLRAQSQLAEKRAGEAALKQVERQMSGHRSEPAPVAPAKGTKVVEAQPAASSAVDAVEGAALSGLRERADKHFNFAYGNNARDWGQRAEYEGKVMEALEDAYEFVGESMRANRETPVSVVLYTKQEYDFHFSGSDVSRAAGFFSGKIRINGAEEMTPEVRAVVVHEYVHAVVDELTHGSHGCPVWVHEGFATYVENLYRERRGMPDADAGWRQRLRSMAAGGQIPSLATLNQGFLNYPNPRLAYATAGTGIRLIIERWGMEAFVQLLRDSATKPFGELFAQRFTPDPSDLDAEIRAELGK